MAFQDDAGALLMKMPTQSLLARARAATLADPGMYSKLRLFLNLCYSNCPGVFLWGSSHQVVA